jgi:hypothetical protein
MGFRMHDYRDGRVGLAAFCSVCGEQIRENGYVVWDDPADWLLVHQARCDPGGRYRNSMSLDAEIVYLANSVGVDLDEARETVVALATLDAPDETFGRLSGTGNR